jgi:hypothetical protein
MFIRIVLFLILSALCLPCVSALAQGYPYGPPPPPSPYDYERERRHEEREMRREERDRQRREDREDARRWRESEEWQRYNQRYFGGVVVQPRPYESPEAYAARVRAQCNVQWSNCANFCNTLRDPYQRAACVANCNNELYECQTRY